MQVMYDNVKHLGIPLKAWQAVFNNQFALGELYQMHIGNEMWPKIFDCQASESLI